MKSTRRIQFKVDQGRVLVPVGETCSFGCRYCYTRTGEVGPTRVESQEIVETFRIFAQTNTFDFIQFGYDGEPFIHAERGLQMLQQLALFRKSMSFSTKALLGEQIIEALADLQKSMLLTQTTLIGFVSLSCWDSASTIEPHTPAPEERIETLMRLRQRGIPTFIALRPILPHLPLQEYEQVIDKGLTAGCDGFILGPLYADDHGRFVRFIPKEILEAIPSQKAVVPWSAHAPVWRRYEDEKRLLSIAESIQEQGGRVFTSSLHALHGVSQVGART